MQKPKKNLKLKIIKQLFHFHIKCSLKNTHVTITDYQNKCIYNSSSWIFKKKEFVKNWTYLLKTMLFQIQKYLKKNKIKYFVVYINGISRSRFLFLKFLKKFKILQIIENTPIPFNGCRPKKLKWR